MREFRDSTSLVNDAAALRDRMTEDGYVFLRRALDPDRVLKVRRDVTSALAANWWLDFGSDPLEGVPAEPIRREGDQLWWGGYTAIQALESFHRLAHDPALVDLTAGLIGDEVLVHPRKIARISYPGAEHPTPPHQDFPLIQGATDTITAWVPLGAMDPELGGLRVIPGSHRAGLAEHGPRAGVGGLSVAIAEDDERWVTTRYEPGDVLLFVSLTVHWAPANRGRTLRLSVDYRYQGAAEPIVHGSLHPHFWGGPVPGWDTLAQGWSTRRWIETPPDTKVAAQVDPGAAQLPAASRF